MNLFILCHIVNNYEISCWQHEFLSIWVSHTEHDYIPAKTLFAAIEVDYYPIYELLFKIFRILYVYSIIRR